MILTMRTIPIVDIELIKTNLLLLLFSLAKSYSPKRNSIEKENHIWEMQRKYKFLF